MYNVILLNKDAYKIFFATALPDFNLLAIVTVLPHRQDAQLCDQSNPAFYLSGNTV